MHVTDSPDADDRADFEGVVRAALETPEIRRALRDPGVRVDAPGLRSRALAGAEALALTAAEEHNTYRRLRTTAAPTRTSRGDRPGGAGAAAGGRGLSAALAVLAPLLSGAAAAIFLLLGYTLRLAGSQRRLADAFVDAGWVAAALAALAVLIAALALIFTAARHRSAPGGPHRGSPAVDEARTAWRQALLDRGVLPFLRQELERSAAPRRVLPGPPASGPLPGRRSHLGWSSPDFASPDYAGPSAPGRD